MKISRNCFHQRWYICSHAHAQTALLPYCPLKRPSLTPIGASKVWKPISSQVVSTCVPVGLQLSTPLSLNRLSVLFNCPRLLTAYRISLYHCPNVGKTPWIYPCYEIIPLSSPSNINVTTCMSAATPSQCRLYRYASHALFPPEFVCYPGAHVSDGLSDARESWCDLDYLMTLTCGARAIRWITY
jgi:hypothetical protein